MLELLAHSRNGMVLFTLRTDPIFEKLRRRIGMEEI